MSATPSEAVLVIVGAGPRATGLLERIAANAPELWDDGRKLTIHLVDPHPPGPGRIWRDGQSPLLRMNSMAEDVTMFTDETSTIEGPVRPGPSLAEWAASVSEGSEAPRHAPPDVLAELRTLAGTDFPTRRAQSAYLDWVFRRVLTELPASVTVEWHRAAATAVCDAPDGRQHVRLSGRTAPLTANRVVLAQGHLGSAPTVEHRTRAAFARRHGRFHLPPSFLDDVDLSALRPGEHVVLRGFGLAFIDLMVLLTEGRGGAYRTASDGTLTYLPSGREPVLHVGSRRGVPYHSKTRYRLLGPRPPLPRYFGPGAVDALVSEGRPLDLRRDVWPLMAKEIGFGHYHELFHAHPDRTALSWPEFLTAYDRFGWYSDEMTALTTRAVRDPADRLDFEALDRPLRGLAFATPEAFRSHMRDHIARDVARREDATHSADLGAFLALLSVYGQLPPLVTAGRLTARSVADDLDGWWQGFFSFLASGPPGFRLRRLLALSEAGLVHFLGADLRVGTDETTGTFTATSPTVPGHTVHATALIEAYLPGPNLDRTQDPLLRHLYRRGTLTEEVVSDHTHTHRSGRLRVTPADGRVIDAGLNGPHPRLVALGAPTDSRAQAAFARPRTNAPAFRHNDEVARTLLRSLSTVPPGRPECHEGSPVGLQARVGG
ncbi:FAD/NAD(P)-binding protein [Streptomyces sp. MA25(2023)]|uniref:FAD/NAD(P)-binding protein n=1 Tax=Streptomyces sp. MA25(2023) TaxID=3055078 RepID=UPI0025B26602|nr:FAD/NAD(P)-binding protein [Streptomyces sp. MA25(2023)]MDN3256361.1 FAD/NAD(P)-binding protein [Streptomyces sp. MA25(2023)]